MSGLETVLRPSQENVDERIAAARTLQSVTGPSADLPAAIEQLTTAYCRHLNAVCDALLPQVGPRGGLAWGCIDDSWDIERALSRLAQDPGGGSWDDFDLAHRELRRREEHILERLGDDPALAVRLQHALDHAPTHPHPHAPHHGPLAHLARRLDAVRDHLRDRAGHTAA